MAKSPERPDYYALLRVLRGADAAALKSAYRQVALEWHPDRHPGDPEATTRFQRLVEAYQVLGDPESRRAYDAGQRVAVRFEPGGNLAELVGKLVDQLFGVRTKRPIHGHDVTYRLALGFGEAVLGVERALSIPRQEVCARCQGRGFDGTAIPAVCARCDGCGERVVRKTLRKELQDCPDCLGRGYVVSQPCGDCSGSGVVSPQRPVTVQVPPGVKEGDRLLIRAAGQPGLHGGRAGDCTVIVSVKPHRVLRMAGHHIELERPIPILVALAGGAIRVATAEGTATIRVPPGTRDGACLRMPGHGVPDKHGGGRGDQLVTVRHEYPVGLDEAALSRLREAASGLPAGAFPGSQAFEQGLDDEGS
jgi:molecular chaperone DnaJ